MRVAPRVTTVLRVPRALAACLLPILLLTIGASGAAGAAGAEAATAREPITPLQDIRRGMACTAKTVVHGTTISSFDVEVLDVVAQASGGDARILVRVSGPAVADSGIAQGFSGSPVYCPAADGTVGNAGAISATVGQYGNDVGLVTPIEQMLSLPVRPPSGVRRAPRLLKAARPLAAPLVIAGLSPSLARPLERTARQHGRAVVAAPAGPLSAFAPQALVPGASMAVALSSGAVAASAVGTVTYRDGDTVYGFGHPFESAGRRALLLQDAYVFDVIDNPFDADQVTSYKLAAPGRTLGTLTNDAPAGVVGTLGAGPRTVPLTVRVRDADTGEALTQRTELVDEVDLGDPDGQRALSALASLAVAQAVTTAFDGAPAQETGRLCLTARLRELRRPLRFCNRYVVQGALAPDLPIPLALTMGSDVTTALGHVAGARFRALHLTRIDASARIERGMRLATIRSARVSPRRAKPGQRVRVALRVRMLRGPLRTVRFHTRIPRGIPAGPRTLRFAGTPPEDTVVPSADALSLLLELFDVGGGGGAQTMSQVVGGFERTARYDGVRGRLGGRSWRAHRNPRVRIDGSASAGLRVIGARRRGASPPAEPPRRLGAVG